MASAKKKIVRIKIDNNVGQSVNPTAAATHPPIFTQFYPMTVIGSGGGTQKFIAYDPDGGSITYSRSTSISGTAIDSSTGVLTCTPQLTAQEGDVTITATASSSSLTATYVTHVVMAAAP